MKCKRMEVIALMIVVSLAGCGSKESGNGSIKEEDNKQEVTAKQEKTIQCSGKSVTSTTEITHVSKLIADEEGNIKEYQLTNTMIIDETQLETAKVQMEELKKDYGDTFEYLFEGNKLTQILTINTLKSIPMQIGYTIDEAKAFESNDFKDFLFDTAAEKLKQAAVEHGGTCQ